MLFFKKKRKAEPKAETVERVKEIAREPLRVSESKIEFVPVKTKEEIEEEKWEQRRWELTCHLVAQERRSVVLGKLNATVVDIARKARQIADATIRELRTNNQKNYGTELRRQETV